MTTAADTTNPIEDTLPVFKRADEYSTELLTKIDAGDADWRQELRRMARAHFTRVEMFHQLARSVQAAFAAHVLAGPEEGMDWLIEAAAEGVGLPISELPDPAWYAADAGRWDPRDRPEVPDNCGTVYEPGPAPATMVRPGITGRVTDAFEWPAGQWWLTELTVAVAIDGDKPDNVWEMRRPVDATFTKWDTAAPTPLELWCPELGPRRTSDWVMAGDVHERLIVLQRADGQFTLVPVADWVAVTRNPPAGCEDWLAEQLDGPMSEIRFRSAERTWALLMPRQFHAVEEEGT
jgi:hypothetical protein